ncbi:unnamed protein product [Spirodela intermedia]|uniref:Uncharacterized protein n=1 Tax=Spirodela intermedia TaxID=51605 RepID=A0ABN7E866_SPIIN|nr:unnamed protein product [Spirodela intermedia]
MSAGCRAHSPYLADTKVPSTDAGKPSGPGARCLLIEKTTSLISSPSILSDKASYIELGFEVAYTSTIPYDARYHDLVSGPTSPRSRGHCPLSGLSLESAGGGSRGWIGPKPIPSEKGVDLGRWGLRGEGLLLRGESEWAGRSWVVFEVRGCFPLLKGKGVQLPAFAVYAVSQSVS